MECIEPQTPTAAHQTSAPASPACQTQHNMAPRAPQRRQQARPPTKWRTRYFFIFHPSPRPPPATTKPPTALPPLGRQQRSIRQGATRHLPQKNDMTSTTGATTEQIKTKIRTEEEPHRQPPGAPLDSHWKGLNAYLSNKSTRTKRLWYRSWF